MTSSREPHDTIDASASAAWHRASPGYILVDLLGTLRGLVLPFIVVIVSGDGFDDPFRTRNLVFYGVFGIIFLIGLVSSIVSWRFFRYALTPGRLLVRTGLISRQERSIPYQRIQSVDVVETPVYRMLGLARLRIETAAGGALGGSEVDIKAIRRDDAARVREQLLRARQAARSEEPVAVEGLVVEHGELREAGEVRTEGELVRALTTRELLIAGATSGTIGPAAALVGGLLSQAENLVPEDWWARVPWERLEGAASNLAFVGILILVAAFFAWLLAIAGTVVTYYGFELRRTGEDLFVQHGLLDKRRATIPVKRIQAIRVEEGILRQPFRYVTVKYSSAGHGNTGESGGSGTLFPFLPRRDVYALLGVVAPEFVVDLDDARLTPLPKRALRRYVVGDTLVTALVAAAILLGAWYWRDGVAVWWYLLLALVPFQALMGWLAFRDAGWRLDGPLVMIRSRSFVRSTLITTRRRLQHRKITANPLQRRARLVTLHVAVAAGMGGGTTSLAHIDRADGERLLFALNPRRT